jgi:hypothetical protein
MLQLREPLSIIANTAIFLRDLDEGMESFPARGTVLEVVSKNCFHLRTQSSKADFITEEIG